MKLFLIGIIFYYTTGRDHAGCGVLRQRVRNLQRRVLVRASLMGTVYLWAVACSGKGFATFSAVCWYAHP